MPRHDEVIPPSVIRRLTKYLTCVQTSRIDGVEWISSQCLADALGLTSSTVRQDLSHIDFSGVSRRGYETGGLQRVLEAVLGADTTWNLVVVGAGNLGSALALHEEFGRRGFNILAVFDNSPRRIGARVGSFVVADVGELDAFVKQHAIDIGVIAVPASAAQEVCDRFVKAGVRGLLNLALTHVMVPESVCLVDSRIVASVLELAHAIKFRSRA